LRRVKGFEEAGPTEGRVKKCPVDTFLGRGRIHVHPAASHRDVDGCTNRAYNQKEKGGASMNPKRTWLLLPTILLPYVTLLLAATLFLSPYSPAFEFIVDHVFQENALLILAALLAFCLIALAFSITHFILSVRKRMNPVSLAKCAMVIKWIQVPAYLVIFVLGLILAISLFTIPIAIIFILVDCLTLLLTGLVTISAAVIAVRQDILQTKDVLWIILLQFVFCADVLAATILFTRLRKVIHNQVNDDN